MATVIKGKKLGVHIGRVAVRGSGRFNIQTHAGTVQGISWKRCKVIQRDDGYAYANIPSTPQDRKGGIPPNPMNGVGVLLSTL